MAGGSADCGGDGENKAPRVAGDAGDQARMMSQYIYPT